MKIKLSEINLAFLILNEIKFESNRVEIILTKFECI